MAKTATTSGWDPQWSKHLILIIAIWLIYVGIRFVYTLHPAAGIVCIVAGVILIIYYFWIRDKSIVQKK